MTGEHRTCSECGVETIHHVILCDECKEKLRDEIERLEKKIAEARHVNDVKVQMIRVKDQKLAALEKENGQLKKINKENEEMMSPLIEKADERDEMYLKIASVRDWLRELNTARVFNSNFIASILKPAFKRLGGILDDGKRSSTPVEANRVPGGGNVDDDGER